MNWFGPSAGFKVGTHVVCVGLKVGAQGLVSARQVLYQPSYSCSHDSFFFLRRDLTIWSRLLFLPEECWGYSCILLLLAQQRVPREKKPEVIGGRACDSLLPTRFPSPGRWALTHVIPHEGDADRYGVPGGPRMVTLDVPASAFIHMAVLSNEEAVEEGGRA